MNLFENQLKVLKSEQSNIVKTAERQVPKLTQEDRDLFSAIYASSVNLTEDYFYRKLL